MTKKARPVVEREFESEEAWMVWRLGKGTGSTIHKMVSKTSDATKEGVWHAAAESIIGTAILAEEDLNVAQVFERGHRLEIPAIKRFEEETGKKVRRRLVGWENPYDSRIAISPDGTIGKTEAVEVKCLLSPKHVEALFTQKIPKNTAGYEEQRLHYFVTNPDLRTLYHIFYHPDFPKPLDLFILKSTRQQLKEEIRAHEASTTCAVKRIREIVNKLTMYSPGEIRMMQEAQEELLEDHRKALAKMVKNVQSAAKKKSVVHKKAHKTRTTRAKVSA